MSEATTNVQEHDVELGKFKVLEPIAFTDENGVKMGDLEVGSVQEVPVDLGNSWIEQGKAEKVEEAPEEEKTDEETETEPAEEEEAGPSNEYTLKGFGESDSQTVVFYEMNEDGSKEPGTTIEEMLRVSFERLTDLNGRFPSEFNAKALDAIQEATAQLNARTRDRVARGVEGKHEA